jgi:hypothetical protein
VRVSVGGLVSSSGIGVGGNKVDSGIFVSLAQANNSDLQWFVSHHGTGQGGHPQVLAFGALPASATSSSPLGEQGWHNLSIAFNGATKIVTAYADGVQLASLRDVSGQPSNGWAALACGWNECLYRSFSVV